MMVKLGTGFSIPDVMHLHLVVSHWFPISTRLKIWNELNADGDPKHLLSMLLLMGSDMKMDNDPT